MAEIKSKVVVVPCDSYDEEKVYECMKQGIDLLGGIENYVKKDEKILVKPNFLSAADADKAITTHPSVIKGMLRILSEEGYASVKYGDSPGHGSCKGAAERMGLCAENTFGAECADMSEEVLVKYEEGLTCKEFHFTKEVTEADAIINLCKMKTHALERITGAVKNVYGFICGFRKAAGHVKYPNDSIFARALVDIHRCVKPRLHIMDGIVAMEGNGPGNGDPISMNVLLFSSDPVAVDTVFCYLVNLNPELIPTNVQGQVMGIGTYDEKNIEIIYASEKVEQITREELFKVCGNGEFNVPRKKAKGTFLFNYSKLMTRFARRPYIDKKECVKCGVCVSHCPVPGKAIDFKKGKGEPPVYDYSKCIRCYCCQEMCPKNAIKVKGRA